MLPVSVSLGLGNHQNAPARHPCYLFPIPDLETSRAKCKTESCADQSRSVIKYMNRIVCRWLGLLGQVERALAFLDSSKEPLPQHIDVCVVR